MFANHSNEFKNKSKKNRLHNVFKLKTVRNLLTISSLFCFLIFRKNRVVRGGSVVFSVGQLIFNRANEFVVGPQWLGIRN